LRSAYLPVKISIDLPGVGSMKPLKAIILFLLLVPAPAMVQGKAKKPDKLFAAFNQARYVYVQAVDGEE
jgi:hypothetical protein